MSDFAGLWHLDGRPVNKTDLTRLGQVMESPVAGPVRVWRRDGFGLVHRQHRFTREDGAEIQPRERPSGAVLVAGARLDDRAGLQRALGLPQDGECRPDSLLLALALEAWGVEGALPRLTGHFAFAVWRERERQLILARDHLGTYPLFIHRNNRLIAFSTRLRALLALPDVPRDLDERGLADQMILNPLPPERTLYRAIDRLPKAHLAVLTPERTDTQAWWTLPRPGSRRLAAAETLEAGREVLDLAVGDALRAAGPVTASLTGGLDSAAIVTSAARQLAPAPLLTLTRIPGDAVPPDSGLVYHDESPKARAVAASHANIDWHAVGDDGRDQGEQDWRLWFLEAGVPTRAPLNIGWFYPLYRFMAARGSRVVLGGEFGNCFFSDTGLSLLPELFLRLRWVPLARHLFQLSRVEGVPVASLLKSHVLRPLEPLGLRLRRQGLTPTMPWASHSALSPAFAAEIRLNETLDHRRYRMRVGGGGRSALEMRRFFWHDESASDVQAVMRSVIGIDWRMPLADRRVVEFFGSLPLEAFLQNGITRSLARRLLAGHVPPAALADRTRGRQNGDWFALLSARRPALLEQVHRLRASPMARRVVDLDRLQALLDHWPADAAAAEPRRNEYYQMLVRGVEMAGFLAWHEGGNH